MNNKNKKNCTPLSMWSSPFFSTVSRPWNQKWRCLCPSYIRHHFCLCDLQEDGGKCLSSIKSLDSLYLIKALNKNIETDICTHTKNIVNPVLWGLWNGSDLKKKKPIHLSLSLVCHSYKIPITILSQTLPENAVSWVIIALHFCSFVNFG